VTFYVILSRFQWVKLQLDSIARCRTKNEIQRTLSSLPLTLNETYARILEKVPEGDKPRVYRIFQFLCFGVGTFSLEVLGHVYSIGDRLEPPFDPGDALLAPKSLLYLCSNLLFIRPQLVLVRGMPTEGYVVQLAHFSVKEYLLSPNTASWNLTAEAAHISILKCAIAYYLDCISAPEARIHSINDALDLQQDHPLLRYLMSYIPYHLDSLPAREPQGLIKSLQLLFNPSNASTFIAILGVYLYNNDHYNYSEPLTQKCDQTLIMAAYLGLPKTFEWLLKSFVEIFPDSVNTRTSFMGYIHCPIVAAATSGHKDIVQLLLDMHVNVNQKSHRPGSGQQSEGLVTAIFAASDMQHLEVVKILQAGADLNAACGQADNVDVTKCDAPNPHEVHVGFLIWFKRARARIVVFTLLLLTVSSFYCFSIV
jgi:hypothetical protein